MTFQQLIEKYNGRYVEVAGSQNALNQCTDLANLYIRDVLNLPIIEWTNAIDFPTKAGDNYEYILNSPTNVPLEGDLVVWKPSPGHIAIFVEGNADKFKSYDQNFPTGSPCHVQDHNYTNVLGWLRRRNTTIDPKIILNSDNWIALITNCDLPDNKDAAIAEVKRRTELADKGEEKDKALEEKQQLIESLDLQMKGLLENNTNLTTKLGELETERDKLIQLVKGEEIKIQEAFTEIAKLKEIKPLNQYSKLELLRMFLFGKG